MTLSAKTIAAVLTASAAMAALAVSNQSYWIDEATSLIVAMAPNPAEAWKYAQAVGGSTIQMPLYHLYLYVWHKVFGSGECAMRASNIPWFLVAQSAFLILLRNKPRLALLAALLAAVSPTVWMYLDEARPYLMQYAAACWLVAAMARFCLSSSANETSNADTSQGFLLSLLCVATFVLFGSSLLGVVWGGGFLCAFLWLYLTRPAETGRSSAVSATNSAWIAASLSALAGAALAIYYAWTWSAAGGGYHRAGFSPVSLPYIAYEFLGFSGFGPGKLEMRNGLAGSLFRSLPALLPLFLVVTTLGVFLLSQTRLRSVRPRTVIAWLLALALPSTVILASLFFESYRPLPRHFIPALPAIILALAALIERALAQPRLIWRAVAVLLPIFWLASSLGLRLREAHAKDDYRTASRLAAAALAESKEVWWAADAAAAHVYLTPIALEEVPDRAWAMQAPSWDAIRFKFPPRVIVLSKPDIYDPQGAVVRYAAENRFVPALQLHAFTIFVREGEALPEISP